jgi:uncharacterized NAD(P)/FAD-binding protein YdhS
MASSRSRTIAVIGSGFSGTALAYRLLRSTHFLPTRIVLVERASRFGCGTAYADSAAGTTLNVPASRMSIDETRPNDLLEYLQSRSIPAAPEEFVPRTLYGDYLEARLTDAARTASARIELTRLNRIAIAVSRTDAHSFWSVTFNDGSSMLADAVVLATGQCPPRPLPGFDALAGIGLYENDPWKNPALKLRPSRVLLIGTGLTMADVACRLARGAHPPREIVALSRRGLLPHKRNDVAPNAPSAPLGFERLQRVGTLRSMVVEVRSLVRRAEALGVDWRDVMVELRDHVPALWRKLNAADKARFLRHVQPYWDIHRHQLPPLVAKTLDELVQGKRLRVRAARLKAVRIRDSRAEVTLQPRGTTSVETLAFDCVINCSGPDGDPRRNETRLMRMLLASGQIVACPTGTGLQVDFAGRPIDRHGKTAQGLYYIGPWLKARDLEATAVQELRGHATALAARLIAESRPAPGLLRRLLGQRVPDVGAPHVEVRVPLRAG